MKVESVAVSSLVLDPSNARKHDQKNLDAIKGSLAKFGQRIPLVVGRNNVVLSGNGRLKAAQALGWKTIEITRAEDLTATEAAAFSLADNQGNTSAACPYHRT